MGGQVAARHQRAHARHARLACPSCPSSAGFFSGPENNEEIQAPSLNFPSASACTTEICAFAVISVRLSFFFVEIVAELGSRFGLTIEQSNARFSAPVLALGFPFFRDSTYIAMLIAPAVLVNRDFTLRPLFFGLFILSPNLCPERTYSDVPASIPCRSRTCLFGSSSSFFSPPPSPDEVSSLDSSEESSGSGAIVGIFDIVRHRDSPRYILSRFRPVVGMIRRHWILNGGLAAYPAYPGFDPLPLPAAPPLLMLTSVPTIEIPQRGRYR